LGELSDIGVAEASGQLAAGSLKSQALAQSLLERVEAREASVGAFEYLDKDRFLSEARRCDRQPRRSPVHGVPIAVKDIFDTAEMPTAYGSRVYAGFRPRADAAAVAIARAAGMVVMGKTVTTEFAGTAPARTRNPHHFGHTPGGSSSGSAAAVAAGMVPLAIGTQTAGSVIRPASYCGVVGYKPTFGLIDRTGAKVLSQSCDTVGLFARSVADAALLSSVLTNRPLAAALPPDISPRIGVYRTAMTDQASAEALETVDAAAVAATRAGATIRERPVWEREAAVFAAHQTILGWDVPHALSYERLVCVDLLQPKTRELVAAAMPSPEALNNARAVAFAAIASIDELFGDCDALLTPAATGAAPAGLESTGEATFNRVWTLLTVPCVTIPAFRTGDGLPVGVQVVTRPGADEHALAVAAFLERALARFGPRA
jgi:amidase